LTSLKEVGLPSPLKEFILRNVKAKNVSTEKKKGGGLHAISAVQMTVKVVPRRYITDRTLSYACFNTQLSMRSPSFIF
jgi:hypothetical protein